MFRNKVLHSHYPRRIALFRCDYPTGFFVVYQVRHVMHSFFFTVNLMDIIKLQ